MTEEERTTTNTGGNTKADEPKVSKAELERLDEFYRTHVVPSGYSFNAELGLHKTPKAEK